jgi:cell division protein FtsA
MAQDLSVGIDIGSYQTKVVAVEATDNRSLPPIRGTGFAESDGLRQGHVIDSTAVTNRVEAAIQQAGESAGQPLSAVNAAISGASLVGRHSAGSVTFDSDQHQITEHDIKKVVSVAQEALADEFSKNHTVLHTFPLAFKVDGAKTMGRPVGLKGSRLAVRVFFIGSLSQHIYDLVAAIEDAGVTVDNVVAGPLAASEVTVNDAQKRAGCVLADIGAETLSLIVFDDNQPVSLNVFSIGSTDITNDIALGLKVSLKKAEQIKCGGVTGESGSEDQLADIIDARLTDIFELIADHLEKINRKQLLPAGIVIAGGGSSLASVENIARTTLDLPTETAHIKLPKTKIIHELENPAWSVSYGTATYGLRNQPSGLLSSVRSSGSTVLSWLQQFLP